MLAFLIQQLDEKDRAQFTDIYEKYKNFVYKIAYKELDNKNDYDDLVQDIFIELIKSFDTFNNLADEYTQKAYLVTIGKRCAIRNNLEHKKLILVENSNESENDISYGDSDYSELVITIKQFDDKYKLPIFMKYVDGYSLQEISEHLDISVSNVKQRIFRGRKMIADALNQEKYYE